MSDIEKQIEEAARKAHDSISDTCAMKWEYVAAFKEGTKWALEHVKSQQYEAECNNLWHVLAHGLNHMNNGIVWDIQPGSMVHEALKKHKTFRSENGRLVITTKSQL